MIPGLPYDAEIAYLESTGTQYIDTGVGMSGNLYFSLSIEPTYSTGDRKYMGVYNSSYVVCQLNGYWRLMATGWYLSNIPVSTDSFTLIERKSDGWYIGGTNVRSLWVEGPSDNNLVVFAFKEENGTVNPTTSLCKIARLKLYTGTTLVRDYIPVRIGTVGYMYDRVSKRLFGNMGTGDFVLGPDVARPVMGLHTYPQVYTASDYVQDGLIAMWDGIENAGWGKHDNETVKWKSLVGDAELTIPSSASWTDNSLLIDRNGMRSSTNLKNTQFGMALASAVDNRTLTVENVWTLKEYGTSAGTRLAEVIRRVMGPGGTYGWLCVRNANSVYLNSNTYGSGHYCTGVLTAPNGVVGTHSLQATYSKSGVRSATNTYCDGKFLTSNVLPGTAVSDESVTFEGLKGNWYIGQYSNLHATVDNIHCYRIYSRTLSDDELAHNYLIDRRRFGLP